jgi:hypothetical protein
MPRKIKSWEELVGLESKKYKLEIEVESGYGWILPKSEEEQTRGSDHCVYLSTHTFYPSHCKTMTEILQKYGFDVELVEDA